MPPDYRNIENNDEWQKLMSEQENVYDRLNHLYNSLGHLESDYQNKKNEIIGIISKVEKDAKEIDSKVENFLNKEITFGADNE